MSFLKRFLGTPDAEWKPERSSTTTPNTKTPERFNWAVPMGTAGGVMSVAAKGIAYNAVGARQCPERLKWRAIGRAEIEGEQAGINAVFSTMKSEMGDLASDMIYLNVDFDLLRQGALKTARQAMIDELQAGSRGDWGERAALAANIDLEPAVVAKTFLETMKPVTAKLSKTTIEARAWSAAHQALANGIAEARRTAQRIVTENLG